jgi:Skp family chaperone for outer membrane proteins
MDTQSLSKGYVRMNASMFAAALGLLGLAGVAAAQPVPKPTPPAQPTPAPAPAPTPAPRPPFPAGVKFAFIDIQRIVAASAEGKASSAKVQALSQKKAKELEERQKALQGLQAKLAQGGNVLSDEARGQLEKDISKAQVDIQRAQQDAQAELQDLQNSLQEEFQKKLFPIIQQVAKEKELLILFSRADAGIVWADVALDITDEVIAKFDATSKPAATKPPQP